MLNNRLQATLYMAEKLENNELHKFICDMLEDNIKYKQWRQRMLNRTPAELLNYRNRYPKYNADQLDDEINNINCQLSKDQTLIHGGLWSKCTHNIRWQNVWQWQHNAKGHPHYLIDVDVAQDWRSVHF